MAKQTKHVRTSKYGKKFVAGNGKTKWKKTIIDEDINGSQRYEYSNGKYKIDVLIGRQQGFPGSNNVSIFEENYGGWILDTPKSFSSVRETEEFVSYAMKMLDQGYTGKRVPFYD